MKGAQTMSEQNSQKSGSRSEAQKLERAAHGYDQVGSTSPDAGAFGDTKRDTPTDRDTALDHLADKRNERSRHD
jgi:hypothetical protein